MNRAREKRARGGYARNFQLPAHVRTERVKRASQLSRERTREGDKERERAFEMEMKGKHEERKRGRGEKKGDRQELTSNWPIHFGKRTVFPF